MQNRGRNQKKNKSVSVGIVLLILSLGAGIFALPLILAGVLFLVAGTKKVQVKNISDLSRLVNVKTPRSAKKEFKRPIFEPDNHRPAEDCDHANLPPKARELAQLESLFSAGLYERHEYDKKKREILARYR